MKIRQLLQILTASLVLLWVSAGFAANQDKHIVSPTPKGEQCVEETSLMRANHMEFLLHKRVQTMRDGIRTKKHSLAECINCHATPGENGVIARYESGNPDNKHFCTSCHNTVGVKLDCFDCHADRPVDSFSKIPTLDLFTPGKDLKTIKSPHVVLNRRKK